MFRNWFKQLIPMQQRRRKQRAVQSCTTEAMEIRQLPAANIFVAVGGNDVSGRGTLDAPYATLGKALSTADTGDTVILRNGTYAGNVRVVDPNITIRSFENEWAVISAPINDLNQESTVRFMPTASGGRLQRVEIKGGYYYGVKIESDDEEIPALRDAAKNILIEDCRIHSTGRDAIKITPGCDDVLIRRNEISHTGLRDRSNAEGIDNVNGDRMIVQNNYIHDTSTTGVYAKGGSIGTIIEGNLIQRAGGSGILFGFRGTDDDVFDTIVNPDFFEHIDGVIRNNIVTDTGYAGIGLYGAKNATVQNNTLVNVALDGHGGIIVDSGKTEAKLNPLPIVVPSRDIRIANNIVSLSAATSEPAFEIRAGGFTGTFLTTSNRYYKAGGTPAFSDARTGQTFGLAAWQQHIAGETGSTEGNPQLNSQFHLNTGSPCIDAGNAGFGVAVDYDAAVRTNRVDIGADEFGAGPALAVPPSGVGTGLPKVSFAVTSSTVPETALSTNLVVRLTAASQQTVTVRYAVTGGTAIAGSDFSLVSGQLSFAPGQTQLVLPLPILNDVLDENTETVVVTLSAPVNAEVGSLPVHTVHLSDDDPLPRLQFIGSSSRFDESAGSRSLLVRLSSPSGRSVSVPYRVIRGTATSNRDYALASGTLTFLPGQIQKSIPFTIREDLNDEPDENFVVALTTPQNAILGLQSEYLVTIADNDLPPQIAFSSQTSSARENAGMASVRVALSAASGKTVRVNYSVSSGTAAAGADFAAGTGTLVFLPGETSKNVPVTMVNDSLSETNETVRITLSASSNGTLGTQSSHMLTILDDETPAENSFITFRLSDGHIYRIRPEAGAQPVDLTLALNSLSPGTEDESVSASPDGRWLAVVTDRFGIGGGWPGLAVVPADLSSGQAVRVDGEVIHPEGAVAIASGGNLVIYSVGDGPHTRDLWAARRVNGVWSATLLTANSPYAFNSQPAVSADGTRVLFNGGNEPFSTGSEAICEVRVDGSGFRRVVTNVQRPAGSSPGALHHADYASDGSIIFEADWTGEQIWRLPAGSTQPVRISSATNDNSPCVLADGRIVSLWLNRPGNATGVHELTIRSANGTLLATLLPGIDVEDIGISCAG